MAMEEGKKRLKYNTNTKAGDNPAMNRVRLRRFILVSSFLHALFFPIASSLFHNLENEERVTIPRPIEVGFLGGYSGSRGGNSPHTILKRETEQKREATKPVSRKIDPLKRNVVKTVTKKREEPIKTTHAVIQKRDINPSETEPDVQITASQDTGPVSAWRYGTGEGIGNGGTMQGTQIAYPDYRINPKPRYPMIARRKGYEGVVLLRVWVLDNGRVGRVELERSSSHKVLDDSALDAVKDWVFIPGKKDGVPISSWVTVPIKFQLSSG